jgi:RND family efflux transporter MFP subunit
MTRLLAPTRLLPLSLGAALLHAGCGRGTESAATPRGETSVTLTASDVAVVRVAELTDGVSVSGSLEPVQTIPLKAQINGRVRRVGADRGTAVRAGQVLIEIEAEGIRGQAASAKAAVASAEAALALALQRLESARRLHAAGAISDIELTSAQATHEAATAQVAAARAQWTTANESESHAAITSPIDGVVSERGTEPGEAVKDGAVLLTVVDTRTLELAAQVAVDDAMRVRVGAPVVFTLDAAPGQAFRGRVARVDPRADPGTRQVGIASQLPNPGGRIVAGQFARGRVLTGAPARVPAIPLTAVRDSGGVASVFVIENGRLARREIALGARDEEQGLVGVKRGLAAGDRVLAASIAGAAEGLAVTMASDSAARTPATRGAPPPGSR